VVVVTQVNLLYLRCFIRNLLHFFKMLEKLHLHES